jgi:hypothetical protein
MPATRDTDASVHIINNRTDNYVQMFPENDVIFIEGFTKLCDDVRTVTSPLKNDIQRNEALFRKHHST